MCYLVPKKKGSLGYTKIRKIKSDTLDLRFRIAKLWNLKPIDRTRSSDLHKT
jgi:hypothetical protein